MSREFWPQGLAKDLLLLAAVAAALMLPNLIWGPGHTHSARYNYVWVSQFAELLGQGELYPRWLPRSFEGLGSPTFYFYPPLAFYIPALLDLAGFTTLQAISAGTVISTWASGATMYAWLRSKQGNALLGAILYMGAPYHLLDIYVRGALAEHVAFVWLPLLALGISALPSRRGVILTAICYAGLLMTHLPVALLVTVCLIPPLALVQVVEQRTTFLAGMASGVLGLGLAAIYLLPALTLQSHVSTELLWGVHYQPQTWFLLGERNPQKEDPLFTVLVSIAVAATLVAGTTLQTRRAWLWAGITITCSAAAFGLLPLVWDIPIMSKVQFPWRLLCIVEFAAITAATLARSSRLLIGVSAPVVLVALGLTGIQSISPVLSAVVRPEIMASFNQTMPDAPEYLPVGFPADEITDFQRYADLSAYRDLPFAVEVQVLEAGPVILRRAAFPIWRITRDNELVVTRGPLLTFDAVPGVYQVVRSTLWQEQVGALVTCIAAMVLLAVAVQRKLQGSPRSWTITTG